MLEAAEYLIRGLLLGVTYGLLACPISMVFVTTGTLDLAIGAYVVLAGATAYFIPGWVGMVLAVVATMAAASVVGGASTVLNRRFQGDHLIVILASFGFAIVLESLVLTVFGKDPFVRQSFANTLQIFGIPVSWQAVVNAFIGALIVGAIYLILYRSALGRAMRVGASNPRGATLAGIPVRRVQFTTFLLSGALAGVAGLMVLHTTGMTFSSGLPLTITSLGAAIIFGLQRPLYGFIGGLVIGVVESMSVGFAPSEIGSLLPLIFIFAVVATSRLSREEVAGGRA